MVSVYFYLGSSSVSFSMTLLCSIMFSIIATTCLVSVNQDYESFRTLSRSMFHPAVHICTLLLKWKHSISFVRLHASLESQYTLSTKTPGPDTWLWYYDWICHLYNRLHLISLKGSWFHSIFVVFFGWDLCGLGQDRGRFSWVVGDCIFFWVGTLEPQQKA